MIIRRISRYLVSGSLTTLLMLSLVYLFTSLLNIHYLTSTSIAFVITLIVGYITHKYWTFQNKYPEHINQFSKHATLAIFSFFINGMLMLTFAGHLHLPPVISQILTSGILACFNFFVYHKLIFLVAKNKNQ